MAEWLIAGAGIGGLATALALHGAGVSTRVWEKADAFAEVGAGIQIGPNVSRILRSWGLADALARVAAQPQAMVMCDATRGHEVGRLDLIDVAWRYGAPYLTVHRADLHELLRAAVEAVQVEIHLGQSLTQIQTRSNGTVEVQDRHGATHEPDALIGADGVWSRVRQCIWQDGPAVPTGHWAYRAMVPTRTLAPRWRGPDVRVWMAPSLHVVHYPVRRGEWLNVVVLVQNTEGTAQQGWDVPRERAEIDSDVQHALRGLCPELHDVLSAVQDWQAWALCTRPEVSGWPDLARGRVALLGDAAHPMLPYLGQGAGMAIEDAWQLAASVACTGPGDVPRALSDYAQHRWKRNARVQGQSRRNGDIFHARGVVAWARNTALRWAAPQLMDQPWLYGPGQR